MTKARYGLGLFLLIVGCADEAADEGKTDGAGDPAVAAAPSEAEAPATQKPARLVNPSALLTFTSGNGITVEGFTRVSERTYDVVLSTPSIGNAATAKGNGVRITLPPDYASSGKRYPVIYDLHGAGGQSYTEHWYGGQLEEMASGPNADVILVMPDGGKGGWYTDWVDQSIAQKWETYHLTELVPFIDRNLRTIADRSGRGLIGTSMGGGGAARYAVDRPDLFGALATLSGAVNFENVGIQTAVVAPSIAFGLPAFGAFGPPALPGSKWADANPVRRAGRLANVATFLYAGSAGDDPVETLGRIGQAVAQDVSVQLGKVFDVFGVRQVFADVATALHLPALPPIGLDTTGAVVGPITETIVRSATNDLHHALEAAGIRHGYEIIGRQDTAYGYCQADHGWPCLKLEFARALPQVLGALADPR